MQGCGCTCVYVYISNVVLHVHDIQCDTANMHFWSGAILCLHMLLL